LFPVITSAGLGLATRRREALPPAGAAALPALLPEAIARGVVTAPRRCAPAVVARNELNIVVALLLLPLWEMVANVGFIVVVVSVCVVSVWSLQARSQSRLGLGGRDLRACAACGGAGACVRASFWARSLARDDVGKISE